MKKIKFLTATALLLAATAFVGCTPKAEEEPPKGEAFVTLEGLQLGDGSETFEVKQNTLIRKGIYTLKGWVYVTDGATLKIEPGTIFRGDKATKSAIIVERGGKILAEGTQDQPIVFTSGESIGNRKPGDWGGIILCGRAQNNKDNSTGVVIEGGLRTTHGGNDDNDNSGILKYVRIEFAGYPFQADQEINGLTMGSVGRGTTIEYVQVSFCNDDAYEWFGGTVNAKHLISLNTWDDDFDTDLGYTGNLQFLLAVRHSKLADTSVSNGFESDNNSSGSTETPATAPVFSNVTLIGPKYNDPSFQNTTAYIDGGSYKPYAPNISKLGQFQAAMHLRRNTQTSCLNSVAVGFPVGLIIDNEKGTSQTNYTSGKMVLKNLFFADMTVLGSDKNKSFNDYLSTNGKDEDSTQKSFSSTSFGETVNQNVNYTDKADLKLSASYKPQAGSPLLASGAVAFTNPKVTNSFFTPVTYAGAFSGEGDTWAQGWTEFDPSNKEY